MQAIFFTFGAFMLFLVLPGMAIGYTKRAIRMLKSGAPAGSFFVGVEPVVTPPVSTPATEDKKEAPAAEKSASTEEEPGFAIPLSGAIETKTVWIADDERLVLRLYLDEKTGVKFITRSLRSQFGKFGFGGRQVETAQELKQLTAACCAKVNAPFSIAGAIEITCAELSKLQRDYFDENRYVAAKDDKQANGQGTGAVQDKASPLPSTQQEPAFELPKKRVLSAPFEGVVMSAQPVMVEPEDGKTYSIFQVHVKGLLTEQAFNGVELEEKFAAKAFKVGDRIRIERKRTNLTVVKNGKTHRRSRNIYFVEVVKSA